MVETSGIEQIARRNPSKHWTSATVPGVEPGHEVCDAPIGRVEPYRNPSSVLTPVAHRAVRVR